MDTQLPGSAQPYVAPSAARPGNGMGVAALVAAVLGGIAVTCGRADGATNSGPAIAGLVCGVVALVIAIVLAVRFGTFIARNTNVFTTFDNCIARAGNRSAVSNCIAQFANGVRP